MKLMNEKSIRYEVINDLMKKKILYQPFCYSNLVLGLSEGGFSK